MRDRLIELLEECRSIEGVGSDLIEKQADHLLANGVIVPPCKVGDKVYFIGHVSDSIPDFIYGDTITKIGVITRGIIYEKGIDFADIGKTVFLSRKEAEQALKGERRAEIH